MFVVVLGAAAILPGLLAQTSRPANAGKLTQAWTFTTATGAPAAAPGRGGIGGGVTPIVVNGIMYLPAANLVVAVETDTPPRAAFSLRETI